MEIIQCPNCNFCSYLLSEKEEKSKIFNIYVGFRPLKANEMNSQLDTLAKKGGSHLLCIQCDKLIPKEMLRKMVLKA